MEDHLKNKNRLEEEWEALCAYQAEPNSSLVARREENLPKNRCPAVLTCTYPRELGRGGRRFASSPPAALGAESPPTAHLSAAACPHFNSVDVALDGPPA